MSSLLITRARLGISISSSTTVSRETIGEATGSSVVLYFAVL
jgi:hypothetical protein